MKRLLIIAASFSLAGCGGLTPLTTISDAIAVGQDKVAVPASQGLILAHNAYQGAAAAATAAVEAGLVKGENLDRLEQLNARAVAMLAQADAGHNVAFNTAGVFNIISEINTIVRK